MARRLDGLRPLPHHPYFAAMRPSSTDSASRTNRRWFSSSSPTSSSMKLKRLGWIVSQWLAIMFSVGFPHLFFHADIISHNFAKCNCECKIMSITPPPSKKFSFSPLRQGSDFGTMFMLRFHLCGRCSAGASGCADWLADDAKEGFCNYLKEATKCEMCSC